MSNSEPVAVVSICSDKRLYKPTVRFLEKLQQEYGVMTDPVALPGPDGIAVNPKLAHWAKAHAEQVKLLVDAHHAEMLISAPHYTCAGNPIGDAEHDEASKQHAAWLAKEIAFSGTVVAGCAVKGETDDDWSWKELERYAVKDGVRI